MLVGICWTPLASTHGHDALNRKRLRIDGAVAVTFSGFGGGRGTVEANSRQLSVISDQLTTNVNIDGEDQSSVVSHQ